MDTKLDSLTAAIDSLNVTISNANGQMLVFMGFFATLSVGLYLVWLTLRGH